MLHADFSHIKIGDTRIGQAAFQFFLFTSVRVGESSVFDMARALPSRHALVTNLGV